MAIALGDLAQAGEIAADGVRLHQATRRIRPVAEFAQLFGRAHRAEDADGAVRLLLGLRIHRRLVDSLLAARDQPGLEHVVFHVGAARAVDLLQRVQRLRIATDADGADGFAAHGRVRGACGLHQYLLCLRRVDLAEHEQRPLLDQLALLAGEHFLDDGQRAFAGLRHEAFECGQRQLLVVVGRTLRGGQRGRRLRIHRAADRQQREWNGQVDSHG